MVSVLLLSILWGEQLALSDFLNFISVFSFCFSLTLATLNSRLSSHFETALLHGSSSTPVLSLDQQLEHVIDEVMIHNTSALVSSTDRRQVASVHTEASSSSFNPNQKLSSELSARPVVSARESLRAIVNNRCLDRRAGYFSQRLLDAPRLPIDQQSYEIKLSQSIDVKTLEALLSQDQCVLRLSKNSNLAFNKVSLNDFDTDSVKSAVALSSQSMTGRGIDHAGEAFNRKMKVLLLGSNLNFDVSDFAKKFSSVLRTPIEVKFLQAKDTVEASNKILMSQVEGYDAVVIFSDLSSDIFYDDLLQLSEHQQMVIGFSNREESATRYLSNVLLARDECGLLFRLSEVLLLKGHFRANARLLMNTKWQHEVISRTGSDSVALIKVADAWIVNLNSQQNFDIWLK